MPATWIDSLESLSHVTHYWKNYSFMPDYLKLQDVVDSLSSEDRLVEARPVYASRWVIVPKGATGVQEAVFHTVGVYRWGLNEETGNFVLRGEKAPSSVAESRIQYEPSSLCQFSYALDTHRDKTIWAAQKAFENYVQNVEGFNKGQKQRRSWQDGSSADKPNSSFVFNSQIFVKRNASTRHKEAEIPYELHPWIKKITSKPGCEYFANPDRPSLFEVRDGALRDIKECSPPYLKKGDLVWVSFHVEFIIGGEAWATTLVPYEIVRVGSVSPELVGDTSDRSAPPVEVAAPRTRLRAGMRVDIDGDFPMHNTMDQPVPAAAATTPDNEQPEEPNEIYLRPEDARNYGWESRYADRRSGTPIEWAPSRDPSPENEDEGPETSIEEAVASSVDSPSYTPSTSPEPAIRCLATTDTSSPNPAQCVAAASLTPIPSGIGEREPFNGGPLPAAELSPGVATPSGTGSHVVHPSSAGAPSAEIVVGSLIATTPNAAPSTSPGVAFSAPPISGSPDTPQSGSSVIAASPTLATGALSDGATLSASTTRFQMLCNPDITPIGTSSTSSTPTNALPLRAPSAVPRAAAVFPTHGTGSSSATVVDSGPSSSITKASASRVRLLIKLPPIHEVDEHLEDDTPLNLAGKGKKRAVEPAASSAEVAPEGRRSSARVARRRVA